MFDDYRMSVIALKCHLIKRHGVMTPKTLRLHINKLSFVNVKLKLPGNSC